MLSFDEETHTYRADGKVVPSVTQILGVLNDFSKVPWQQLEAARERGTLVHQAAELMLRDELDWYSIDGEIAAYLTGLQKFLKDSGAVILTTEQRVHHAHHKYAGTLDATMYWRKGKCLADWKTSLVLPGSVEAQLAAYAEALRCETGQNIRRHYCVRLLPGEYLVDRVDTNKRGWPLFLSCLNIWRHMNAR